MGTMRWFDGPNIEDLYKGLRAKFSLPLANFSAASYLAEADECAARRNWPRAFELLLEAKWYVGYEQAETGITENIRGRRGAKVRETYENPNGERVGELREHEDGTLEYIDCPNLSQLDTWE